MAFDSLHIIKHYFIQLILLATIILSWSCSHKIKYNKLNTSDIYSLIRTNKADSLENIILEFDLNLIDKELAVNVAVYLDSVKNNDYFVNYYGKTIKDIRLARRITTSFNKQNHELSKYNFSFDGKYSTTFHAIKNQGTLIPSSILLDSYQQWADSVRIQNSDTSNFHVFPIYNHFCLERLLNIMDVICLTDEKDFKPDQYLTYLNMYQKKLNLTYEPLQFRNENINCTNTNIYKLIKPVQSLNDVDLLNIPIIKDQIFRNYANNNSSVISIGNGSKSLLKLDQDTWFHIYLLELVDNINVKIILVNSGEYFLLPN